MKVLFIHTAYQYKGGEDTVVEEEVKLLRESGVQVEQLKFSNSDRSLLKLVQLPFNLTSYSQVKKRMQRFKPDVVHIHNFHFAASPSVIYAVKSFNCPLVLTLHNYRLICPSATLFFNGQLFENSLSQKFPWTAVKKGVYKKSRLMTFWLSLSSYLHNTIGTFDQCDRCIVLTHHALELIKKSRLRLQPGKMVLKPNFCEAPPVTQQQKENYFLYVGRLSPEKGIYTLLKAFKESNHTLKIAGDGPLKEEVSEAASTNTNIDYLGILPRQDIVSLMQGASALIFPSLWYEGMPLTIIEAFSCGLPVIASNLGAMKTMITHQYNGLHFTAEDPIDLLQQLAFWQCLSQAKRQFCSANALQTYNQLYTPKKNADILLEIYRSLLTPKSFINALPALLALR